MAGLQGVGKTTQCGKLATLLTKANKKVRSQQCSRLFLLLACTEPVHAHRCLWSLRTCTVLRPSSSSTSESLLAAEADWQLACQLCYVEPVDGTALLQQSSRSGTLCAMCTVQLQP